MEVIIGSVVVLRVAAFFFLRARFYLAVKGTQVVPQG